MNTLFSIIINNVIFYKERMGLCLSQCCHVPRNFGKFKVNLLIDLDVFLYSIQNIFFSFVK